MRRADGFSDTVRSEWVKLRTLRSTWLVLTVASALALGIGVLSLHSVVRGWPDLAPSDRAAFDPVSDSFNGFEFVQLAFGALGAVVLGAEYGLGTIDTTLLSVPRRGQLYAAKLVVLAAVLLVVAEVDAFASFGLGQLVLRPRGLDVGLTDPGVAGGVVWAGLLLTVVTLVGAGLGALFRHSTAAVGALVALVFLSWPVARAVETFSYLPDRWLLVNASGRLVSSRAVLGPDALRTPGHGLAVLVVLSYLVVFLGLGGWRFRRDP